MKNLKNLRKGTVENSASGITLIALVITIIVLLILAGVSIAMLTGENSILNRAGQASAQNQIGAAQDAVSLLVADKVAEFYEKAYVDGTTATLQGGLNKYLKDHISATDVTNAISNGNIQVDTYTPANFETKDATVFVLSITDNTKKYTSTGTVNNGKVTWGMGSRTKTAGTTEAGPTIVGEDTPQIGDKVNYDPGDLTTASIDLPEGAEIKRTKLASLNLPAGASLNDEIDASEATDWVILDYNSSTGEVLIVPTTYDSSSLVLTGMDGYNNAEDALDMVAGIYLNDTYAKSSRSIRVEDVNKLSGYDPVAEAATSTSVNATYKWNNRYGMDAKTAKIIDYGEGKENIERTYKNSPKITNYSYNFDENENVPEVLRYNSGFLASRCIFMQEGSCNFRVRHLDGHYVGYNYDTLLSACSDGGVSLGSDSDKVIPVVSLKSEVSMEKDSNDVWQLSIE